jgi:putative transposase
MRGNLEIYRAFFILLTYIFKPRYDTRMQLLTYQVTMLRNRIDASRIIPTNRERAELIRLGALIEHDVSDVILVVKPATYRRWIGILRHAAW